VHEQVYGRINVAFRSLGQQALKNIERKIVVFEVMLGVVVEPPPVGASVGARAGAGAKPAARAASRAASKATPPAARRRAWPLLAGLGLVVLIAVGAIAYLAMTQLTPSGPPTPPVTETPAAPSDPTAAAPPAAAAPADLAALAAAVDALFPATGCTRLKATASVPATVTLTGYVGSAADLDAAVARLQAVAGVGTIANRVAVLPPPLCNMLDSLPAAPMLAAGGPGGPRLEVGGAGGLYRDGEVLRIAVTAPAGQDGHLYIDYLDAQDDSVIHLMPNDLRKDSRVAAGRQVVIGERSDERYQVGPPFGTNLILVVSTRRPLFEGPALMVEKRDAYLARLAAALQAHPDAAIAYAPLVFAAR
jgi:hypothetical protein